MKILKWFYPLSIFTFLGIIDVQAQCNPATEKASLIDFYNKTNGRFWSINRWNTLVTINDPVCPTTGNPWPGIKCNSAGCVTHLELRGSGLSNTIGVADIPALNLPNAQVIDLSNNRLSGELNSFYYSPKLTNLNVSSNSFTGIAPTFTSQELVEIDISNNGFSSSIPPYSFPKLVKLALDTNAFTGQIPNFDLPKLQSLLLQNNKLSGCLPRSLDTFCNRIPATTVNLNNNTGLSSTSFAAFCGTQRAGRCSCSAATATISNIKTSYCKDDPSVVLTGAPTGGVLKIDGVPLAANTLNPSLLTVGTSYKITYTLPLTSNGCPNEFSQSITITAPCRICTSFTANLSSDRTSICQGSSTNLSFKFTGGSAPYTVRYSDGTTTNTLTGVTNSQAIIITPTVNRTYTLVGVTDANGCPATIGTNVAISLVNPTVNITGVLSFCAGSSTVLTATGGGSYTWTGGSTNATLTVTTAGTYAVTATTNGCSATKSVQVTTNPLPTLPSASVTNVRCNGGSDGQIIASASGGTGAINFSINPVPTGSTQSPVGTFNNLTAQTYTITAKDINNCSNASVSTVGQPTSLILTLNSTNPTNCTTSNGSINAVSLGGTPPYTYRWNNGATTAAVSNLAAGTYTLTMTDSKGCTTINTATITCATSNLVLNQPTLLTVCNAATATINVSWSGGQAPYRLTYGGAATGNLPGLTTTSQQISNLVAGNYTITVTCANNCSQTVNFLVTIPPLVSVAINSTNATNCTTSNGSVNAVGSGGTPPYTYRWNNGATAAAVPNLAAGTYTLTMTDSKGCTTVGTTAIACTPCNLTLNQPTLITVCNAPTAAINISWSGGQTPYKLTYSGATTGSLSGLTTTSQQINNLMAGNHSFIVIDANNCSQTVNFLVTIPPLVSVAATPTNATNCTTANGAINTVASGGTPPYSYRWSNGATTAAITNLATGTYTLTVTDSKACTTTATTAIACTPCNLTLNQPTLITVCNAPTATINVSWAGGVAPYKLTYSGATTGNLTGISTTSQQVSNLIAGNHTFTVIDANNCSQVVNFLVTIPSLVSVVINPTNATNCTTANGSVSAVGSGGTPPYTYRWNNGETTAGVSNLSAGAYTLTMTDSKGCTTTASTMIQCSSTCNLVMSQPTALASCNAQTAQINVSWTGGQAPYNLTYSGASTGTLNGISGIAQQVNNLSAGNYSISIVDANNCSQIKSVTVITPPLLSLTTSKTDASVCLSDNGSATVTASGGTTPYTYIWNNGKTTALINALAAGTYTATVTDGAGCTKNQTVIVNSITDSLAAPLVSVISIGVDSIFLGWSTVPNAAKYEVQTNDSTWIPANGSLRHTIRGLKPFQTVVFKVRGVAATPKCGARITRMQARTENEKCLEILANNIPSGFTPGNNGKNDFFDPEQYLSLSGCSSNIKAQALNIFNQWGEIIFKAQPYEKWDGKSVTYQKIVPSGAYYYILIINSGDKTQSVKGVLNILRD
jgi:gliding motility-associated-like protein